MSWRGESWADIVERAARATRERRPIAEREDREALAARAQPWTFEIARVAVTDDGLVIGSGMESVVVAFAQLYHVEPIDPWPSLALGWVDRGDAYSSVLAPREPEADTFARAVEEAVEACERRIAIATARGWLEVPVHPWEPADAMPGERDEGPAMRGYRMAPEVPDPILATRKTDLPTSSLWTWLWAHLRPAPRRIEPKDIALTKRFVYVRTSGGRTVRIPAAFLRTMHRTADGDAVYVFARNTELFLASQPGCPLAAALDARLS
jgi:hypothetical protein